MSLKFFEIITQSIFLVKLKDTKGKKIFQCKRMGKLHQ